MNVTFSTLYSLLAFYSILAFNNKATDSFRKKKRYIHLVPCTVKFMLLDVTVKGYFSAGYKSLFAFQKVEVWFLEKCIKNRQWVTRNTYVLFCSLWVNLTLLMNFQKTLPPLHSLQNNPNHRSPAAHPKYVSLVHIKSWLSVYLQLDDATVHSRKNVSFPVAFSALYQLCL